jgi:ATP-dependent Lhr-like helicase
MLSGAAIPASVLERDVLPARLAEYHGSDLDTLCTSGEVVWVGAGAIGATDGRVRLVFRDQAPLLVPPAAEIELGPGHQALLDHLGTRGASFWSQLVQASAAAGLHYDDSEVLAALWDLVWAGLVTNDSLAPLRSYVSGKPARKTGRRPRPGRLARLGPPSGAGRWSLVAPLLEPRPSSTEIAHTRALQLLERYGVLTREAALGEGQEGGFAGVYPVLKALEERGRVRRGYFVAGLGAAQFALPGAVDRLRSFRSNDSRGSDDRNSNASASRIVLAATDPAQPDNEGRAARAAGAYVVLIDGELAAYLERGGHSVVTFGLDGWAEPLRALVDRGPKRSLEIRKVNGQPVREVEAAVEQLHAADFVDGYKGLVYRGRRA